VRGNLVGVHVRILIADDDTTSRMVLERTLGKLGYGVRSARDGAEAWGMFQKERASVVITDWMMPRMDGLDLCRRIRQAARPDRYTYLLVLTAVGGKKNYLDAMNAGADDFLTKPFDPDELVTRLRVAERILGTEAALRDLESMLRCCPDCRRVRDEGGRWIGLRELARERTGTKRAPRRCPECEQKQLAPCACEGQPVGAPTLK
jgi:DNA-binding response OmpR family regulator